MSRKHPQHTPRTTPDARPTRVTYVDFDMDQADRDYAALPPDQRATLDALMVKLGAAIQRGLAADAARRVAGLPEPRANDLPELPALGDGQTLAVFVVTDPLKGE